MPQLHEGDRVRIDIPNESDPDFEEYHGRPGTITSILNDDANLESGDSRDRYLYRIALEDGGTIDMRWRDLRPIP